MITIFELEIWNQLRQEDLGLNLIAYGWRDSKIAMNNWIQNLDGTILSFRDSGDSICVENLKSNPRRILKIEPKRVK